MLKFDFDLKRLDTQNCITTGFNDFDSFLGNTNRNDCLITIGARPSMGKTSFSLSICNHLLKNKHRVLYVSLDYSKYQIEKRFIENKLKDYITDQSQTLLKDTVDYYKQSNLFICATTHLDISQLEKLIKEIKPEFVFIDYVQLLKMTGIANITESVNLVIYELKRISMENNLCMFLLSQLSRKPENRLDKRPVLSDLKDASILEELSDVVLMIYREKYYDLNTKNNLAQMIIRKNDFGMIGYFNLSFRNGFFENTPKVDYF